MTLSTIVVALAGVAFVVFATTAALALVELHLARRDRELTRYSDEDWSA